ncbi:hypothetical protein KC336_g9736, partial [Hortaea werneckii]
GPRPVEFGKEAKRPTVAGLAAVPAAYRPAQKKQESSRPKSQEPLIENERRHPEFPKPPPIPNLPEYMPRPVSRGSIKSLPSQKSTNMTPEKARLMKALELRKKQMRKSNPQQYTINSPKDEVTPAMPKVPEPSDREAAKSSGKGAEAAVSNHSQHPAISNKADSGIEIDYEKQQERRDELTQGKGIQEESTELPANHSTLHQLEASSPPQLDSIPSRSEASSPRPDTDAEAGAESTISLNMLDDAPQPSFPWIDEESSSRKEPEADQPSPHGEPVMSATSITSSSQPKSPAVSQPATYRPSGADRAEERLAISGEARFSSESYRQESGDLAKRRRGIVEPLDIDPQLNHDSSPDEELPKELQDPVSVSHSPMAEDIERRRSTHSAVSEDSNPSTRSVNVPRSASKLPGQSESPRASRNQALATQPSHKNELPDDLKRNTSTSQSKGSHQPSALGGAERGSTASMSPEVGPTNTWRDRKTAVRSPPRSRPGSFRRQSARDTPVGQTPSHTPTWNVQHDPSLNRDSISVSARIVRPPPRSDMGNTSIDGQLHHSQLTVNHKRASVSNQNRRLSPLQTSNLPKSESAPSSMAHPPAPENRHFQFARPSVIGRWQGNQGTSSPLTPSADDFPPPPTQRHSHASSMNVGDDSAVPKEGSRTSRFFKRMSNFGTGHKRRTSGQNVMSAMSALDVSSNQRSSTAAATDKSDTPPAVVVGDLNVQFPDSLLWKRRIVEIDDGGHIVFAISQAMDVQRAAVKRFHLSEFKQPYAPDLERQELPHSIMLEFSDGTALQTACEDAMTARQVLHTANVSVASLSAFDQAYGQQANPTKGSWLSRVSHRASHIPNRPPASNLSASGSRENLPLRAPGSAGFFAGGAAGALGSGLGSGGSAEQLPVLQKTSSYPTSPASPASPTETEFAGATPIDASFGDRADLPEPPVTARLHSDRGGAQRSRSGTATQADHDRKKNKKKVNMDRYAHQAGDDEYDSDGEADDEFERTVFHSSPTMTSHYDDQESHPSESEEEHESIDGDEDTPTTQGWGTDREGRSPTGLMTSWTEEQVADYIASLSPALKQYSQAFANEGIVGDALVALTHDELRELGVASVGHRLTILKAVYEHKVRSGIKIEEGDYVPLSAEGDKADMYANQDDIARIIESIKLRDQRIIAAEQELRALKSDLDRIYDENRKLREETLPIMRLVKDQRTPLPDPAGGTIPSPRDVDPPKQENLAPASKETKGSSLSRKFSTKKLFLGGAPKNPSPTHPPQSHTPQPREVRDDPGGSHLEASAAAMAASSHLTASMTNQQSPTGQQLSPTSPAYSSHAPSSGGSYHQPGSAAARSFPREATRHAYNLHNADDNPTGYSSNSQWSQATTNLGEREPPGSARIPTDRGPSRRQAPTPSPREDETPQTAPLPRDRERDRDRAGTGVDRDNPQVEIFKSFRVSIEDPCKVVLPVALKRYNITDDWRQYSLYIVHGDQERCLGLQEKPLMLFKQLDKEGRKPMFMLRRHASPQEGWSGTASQYYGGSGGGGGSGSGGGGGGGGGSGVSGGQPEKVRRV